MQKKRAAIYARYSTDLQNERSVEDQFALCRTSADRQGFDVVAEYSDRARSGASMIDRDGLLDMMAAAKAGAFDVVIVEALDRLSRSMHDLSGLFETLSFSGVQIRTVHEGAADHVQIGVRGLLSQLFLQDLAHKTRRGMTGTVQEGRHAGGRLYGYRQVLGGKPGELEIDEAEAAVVRRIFAEYREGRTPREIAIDLNRERIPAPRGGQWNASTINGNSRRGNGIIRNPLYAGTMIWGKNSNRRNPETGKRVNRPNPESEWQRIDVPHLAIIDRELFDAVNAEKAARSHAYHEGQPLMRKPHLLSGLLTCGCCGRAMTINGQDKVGRRISCGAAKDKGTCTHGRKYSLKRIEEIVIGMLRRLVDQPEALAVYVEEYLAERRRLAASAKRRQADAQRRLDTVNGEIHRLLTAYLKQVVDEAVFEARTLELRAERKVIEAELQEVPLPPAVEIHPMAEARFKETVHRLHDLLNKEIDARNMAVVQCLREFIDRVVVHSAEPGEIDVEVLGKLKALVDAPVGAREKTGALRVVAGGGIEPPT